MDQKIQFVSLAATGRFSVSQLCEDFDISRKTGHKWLSRYAADGSTALVDLSRRPRHCAHQTSGACKSVSWCPLKRGQTQNLKIYQPGDLVSWGDSRFHRA